MRALAGPGTNIHFTSLSKSSASSLATEFQPSSESLANAECHQRGILDLMEAHGISLDRVCLLDPKAAKALSPEDGDGIFDWFLFGVRTPLHFRSICPP
jgi:ribosome biogenesis SPOUT family RNA methylase Rps3